MFTAYMHAQHSPFLVCVCVYTEWRSWVFLDKVLELSQDVTAVPVYACACFFWAECVDAGYISLSICHLVHLHFFVPVFLSSFPTGRCCTFRQWTSYFVCLFNVREPYVPFRATGPTKCEWRCSITNVDIDCTSTNLFFSYSLSLSDHHGRRYDVADARLGKAEPGSCRNSDQCPAQRDRCVQRTCLFPILKKCSLWYIVASWKENVQNLSES